MPLSHVLLVNVDAMGHLNPSLQIARALQKRGTKVTVYLVSARNPIGEATKARIESLDMNVAEWSPPNLDISFLPQGQRFGLAWPLAAHIGPDVAAAARLLEPPVDCILYDPFAPLGHVLARLLHLPAAASISWLPAPGRHREIFWDAGDNHKVFDGLLEKHGIDIRGKAIQGQAYLFRNDLNFVYSVPEAVIPEEDRPSYKFVGALVEARDSEKEVEGVDVEALLAEKREGGKRVVYVSLGTIVTSGGGMLQAAWPFIEDFFRMVLRVAVRMEDVARFLVAIPGKGPEVLDTLGVEIPSSLRAYKFVPQLRVLESLADVFVSHVGANSTSESMFFGVPLAAVPFFGDQIANGDLVQRLGCGVTFPHDPQPEEVRMKPQPRASLTEETLETSLRRMLTDGSPERLASARLSADMKGSCGVEGAADAMEEYAQKYPTGEP